MLGISPETRVILVEEFRRQVQRRSWQILTFLVPAVLLIALIAVPVVRELVSSDESETPLIIGRSAAMQSIFRTIGRLASTDVNWLVWFRMLSPVLGGSSFTFGLILAVALLGIGLGIS